LAAENHFWGAPRIHGELLKFGIAVSERTVSRYLQGRPTAPSQTWRTFFANHLGDLAFMPPVMSSSAPDDDDVVDASGFSFHPMPLSLDGLCAAKQSAVVDKCVSRNDSRTKRTTVAAALLFIAVAVSSALTVTPWSNIQTVFVIVLENHNWSEIKGNSSAPYINSLLPRFAHAERYFNPPGLHPSLPNYLWLEAGQNFGIFDDNPPSVHHLTTRSHLSTQLEAAGVSWKAYQENISGTTCPLVSSGLYAVKHNPFVYFDDVTDGGNPTSAHCIAHVRPYSELENDLQQNQVARYNFITPNLCHDMHDCSIATGDAWLSTEVPKILGSAVYQHGVLFITFDESETGDGPIALIAVSPFVRPGYSNGLSYTHSSTLRTFQEIFGVTPFLGDAANATDLSDLFAFPPSAPTNLRVRD